MAASELKKRTIDSLKRYNSLIAARESLGTKLAEYDEHLKPENLTAGMAKKLMGIRKNFDLVTLEIKSIDAALDSLDYSDRRLLDKFFISRTQNYMTELCREFSLETAQIYRLKERALERYSLAKNGKSLK